MFKFKPENALERSLVRATLNPVHRPAFYREFARATVFLVHHGPRPREADGAVTLKRGAVLRIAPVKVDGKSYLPVFTSARRLSDTVRGDVDCITINAAEFLRLVRGAEVVLNPGSGFGKVFTREEIDSILSDAAGGDG